MSGTRAEKKGYKGIDVFTLDPYIYYRVYTMDGAVPSKTAADVCDPFIGRIAATSVPPPHNAATLRRCLANAEGFSEVKGKAPGERTALFESALPLHPMLDNAALELRGVHGGSPSTAVVLKVTDDLTPAEVAAVEAIDLSRYSERQSFLYYHLYTRVGEETSNLCFDTNHPAVGRIQRSRISPPFSLESIRRCIAKAERKPVYAYFSEVYADVTAQSPLVTPRYGTLRADLGLTAERPLVLVQPERNKGLFNRQFVLKKSLYHAPTTFPIGTKGITDGVVEKGCKGCVAVKMMGDDGVLKASLGHIKYLDE